MKVKEDSGDRDIFEASKIKSSICKLRLYINMIIEVKMIIESG